MLSVQWHKLQGQARCELCSRSCAPSCVAQDNQLSVPLQNIFADAVHVWRRVLQMRSRSVRSPPAFTSASFWTCVSVTFAVACIASSSSRPKSVRRSDARLVKRGDGDVMSRQGRDGRPPAFQQHRGAGDMASAQDDQWKCTACNADNWARRTACFACGQPKPGFSQAGGMGGSQMLPGAHLRVMHLLPDQQLVQESGAQTHAADALAA